MLDKSVDRGNEIRMILNCVKTELLRHPLPSLPLAKRNDKFQNILEILPLRMNDKTYLWTFGFTTLSCQIFFGLFCLSRPLSTTEINNLFGSNIRSR